MADPIDRVVQDVRRYRVATHALIEGLERQVSSSDEDVAALEAGLSMTDKMRRSHSSTLSRDLTDRLETFEAARRDIRVSVTAALLHEGLSAGEIGDLFGVTRQLANRFAREARARSDDD